MADKNDSVLSFVSITGASTDSATQYLELTNWSLAEAVNLFMESGGQGAGGDASLPPPAPMNGSYEDDVRAPDPSKRQRLFGDDTMPIRRLHEQYRDFAAESIAAINATSHGPAISAAFGGSSRDEASRSRDLSSLFQPPVNLMFTGSYSEARAAAKSQGKWLLVNIQDEVVFASHMLNRDTWSNDIVENVVASGYIFWQHHWISDQGKKFCSLYQIDRDHLPIVAIVDPRTGEIVQKWSGFIEAQDMTERLSDFAFSQPFQAETAATGDDQKFKRDLTDASEDDQLAAAIAASMEGAESEQSQDSDVEQDDAEEKAAVEEVVLEPMPAEPADGTPAVTRVQLRTPDGSRLTRRFLKSDPISLIWRFVKEQIPEARTRAFELRTTFPPKAIEFSEAATFTESALENASLMIKWM